MLTYPACSDISYIRIWAGVKSLTSSSGFLTVWLSNGTNFTTTGTKCVTGVAIMAEGDGVITCPQVTGARYVTVQRTEPRGNADQLVVHELHAIRGKKKRDMLVPPLLSSSSCKCMPAGLRVCGYMDGKRIQRLRAYWHTGMGFGAQPGLS